MEIVIILKNMSVILLMAFMGYVLYKKGILEENTNKKLSTLVVDLCNPALSIACIIEDNCLIGMGATVLDGAVIGHGSIVGAGAVVAPGKIIPPYSKVMGIPGKVMATMTEDDEEERIKHARRYWNLATEYIEGGEKYLLDEPIIPIETEEEYKKYL